MEAEKEIQALQQILQRERLARKEAEKILETKAGELQKANQSLLLLNKNLEETIHERTAEITSIARFAQENPDPLIRISFSGECIRQNPAAEALLPFFIYKDNRYGPKDFWLQLAGEIDFTSSRWSFEALCGSREFSFACAMHPAEGYINIYGCDVTEQRKAQQALEENEQKWHLALKAAGDGLWEHNLVTKEMTFSRSYKEMLGFEGETFFNNERLWRSRIHPEDIHLIDNIINDYGAGKIKHHATQYRIRKRSGNYIWILDRGTLLAHTYNGAPLKIIGVHTNIDAQKNLELAFKSTAARFSALIANLHTGISMEDEDGHALVTNKKMGEIFGLNGEEQKGRPQNTEAMAASATDLFYEPKRFLESHQQIIKDRRPVSGEQWELTNGRFINRTYIPVYSSNGVFEGNLWVIDDVTEQITNEQALKKQRQFYEHILNSIPADIAVFDAQQQYLFVNPVAVKNEVLHKGLFKGEEDEGKNSEVFAERKHRFAELLQTKGLISWEEELSRSDGSKEHSLRYLYPVLNNRWEVETVIAYGINITERKAIEQKIQRSEKKYRDLINFSYAFIITHDTDGHILSVNPSVCRTLEYAYAELIGKPLSDFMMPEDAARMEEEYLQRIRNHHVAEGVFRVVSKSGNSIYLLYKNYLLQEEGESPYIIGFAQDVTERIKAERELKLAKKATEEAAVAKERFLADMSHEIRTPMNGILGLASLLQKTPLNSGQQEQLGLLKESANNLLVIVNDVLDLEKIASGKMELERLPFTVVDKVESSLAAFRFKIEEKGLQLQHHNGLPKDLTVTGDPYRLSQILNNLLSNALKFTAEGIITVTTTVRQMDKEQVLITYTVQDSGIGIPADKLEAVFDPYMQARPEISRKYGGTGLGLAICKNLAEMQGGTISVQSTEDNGSCFSFSIPYTVAKALKKESAVPQRCTDNSLAGISILVAEDVQINQYLIKHFLAGSGCRLQFVDNGLKAVEAVEDNDYDLVLMDIQMPAMDGLQATRAIRKLSGESKADLPIVALTANALKGDDAKYMAAGMTDYLSKPFTKEALFRTMERVLKRREVNV